MITSNEQKELQRGISQEPKKEEYHNFITDNFICQNEIGSGSFGKVFRVLEKKTGKIYAAKISRQPVEEDSKDLIRNLTREINIISQLNCPSILKFYGYSPLNFKGKPKPVIITEYASNGSLADILARERNSKTNHILNDTQKLIIIYGIASAMSYLHSHNIIHRDLKPDNILLDEFLFPKIADFGLSKNPDQMLENVSMKSINDVKGSPIYISPEIWNKCEYTKACDVYAFSLVLYEIVTNEKPFNKIEIFELWSKIHECYRPEIKPDVPEVYRRLIEKCWAEEPMNRPSFDEILNELKNNHDFITDSIQEKEFLKFVKYIDEYEVTFDSLKAVVPIIKSSMFNHIKINIKSDDMSDYKIKIIEDFDSKGKLFPFVLYNNLDEESKKLVNEAEDSPKKQFVVGKYLIEGQFNFPQNSQIGIKYLKKSICNECLDALIYYCKMIIKGSLIPFNHKKVKKIASEIFERR